MYVIEKYKHMANMCPVPLMMPLFCDFMVQSKHAKAFPWDLYIIVISSPSPLHRFLLIHHLAILVKFLERSEKNASKNKMHASFYGV